MKLCCTYPVRMTHLFCMCVHEFDVIPSTCHQNTLLPMIQFINNCNANTFKINSSRAEVPLNPFHLLCFFKLYDRLNEHILAAGPLPPLLILGGPGSGKSLLLAKWLSNHVNRNPSCLVLYHFVGSPSSRSAVVVNMVQRLTNKVSMNVSVFGTFWLPIFSQCS